MRASMAEPHSLPEQYKEMSLGELHEEIRRMEQFLSLLKEKVAVSEQRISGSETVGVDIHHTQETETQTLPYRTKARAWKEPCCTRSLNTQEYKRYGRQMIMPEVGLSGQLALKKAKVLIVGVGGLGSPAAAYLAAAGIGTIGLVDGDKVELSNLHRQIIHAADREGMEKVDSAGRFIQSLNKEIEIVAHRYHLSPDNAVETLEDYDVVLDCTDRPATRYLVSDAAVIAKIPLVHGSALQTEGQLMVLNNPPITTASKKKGPCYRCIWPKPPPPQSILTCGEGGILGPVVGVIGVLMAMETMKILLPGLQSMADEPTTKGTPFLLYSAHLSQPFKTVTMRGARENCPACAKNPNIRAVKDYDYDAFCGLSCPVNILPPDDRIEAKAYRDISPRSSPAPILVDVRDDTQYNMCHIDNSINMPWSTIREDPAEAFQSINKQVQHDETSRHPGEIYFICRFGNDSQLAVRQFREQQKKDLGLNFKCKGDVRGGLKAWREQVDPDFPDY